MKLLTKEIEKTLPAYRDQEETKIPDQVCYLKLFSPYTGWTWYATEYDPENGLLFGVVVGLEVEMGDFALSELENLKKGGLQLVERDMHFSPTKLKDIQSDTRLQDWLARFDQ